MVPSAFGEGLPVPDKSADAGLTAASRYFLMADCPALQCVCPELMDLFQEAGSVFYRRPLLESFFISHGVELRKDLDIVPEALGSFGYLIKGAF